MEEDALKYHHRTNVRVTAVSIASNVALTALKLAVGLLTGSTAVLAEAVHSVVDLLAAVVAHLSVRKAAQPADKGHPYGHGKFDSLSGLVESVLIFGAAGYIIYESVRKIIVGSEVEMLGVAFAVMVVSAAVNIVVSAFLFTAARKTGSEAVEADARHLSTDVLTSAGVAAGLVLIAATGATVFDPIAALVVTTLIVKSAWTITKRSAAGLLDESLPAEEVALIERIIREKQPVFVDFYRLRTRRSGIKRWVDLTLASCPDMTVAEAHKITDDLESEIAEVFPGTDVMVHIEPCEREWPDCARGCPMAG